MSEEILSKEDQCVASCVQAVRELRLARTSLIKSSTDFMDTNAEASRAIQKMIEGISGDIMLLESLIEAYAE
jgi:hypothetical protein